MKNKQIALILIAILVVLGIVFVSSKISGPNQIAIETEKIKATTETDPITLLLTTLEKNVGLKFPVMSDTEFGWNIENGKDGRIAKLAEINIKGKGLGPMEITSEEHQMVEKYFTDEGFKMDVYNAAAGTIGGLTGYKKDNIVCVVSGMMIVSDDGMPLPSRGNEVTIKCGLLE